MNESAMPMVRCTVIAHRLSVLSRSVLYTCGGGGRGKGNVARHGMAAASPATARTHDEARVVAHEGECDDADGGEEVDVDEEQLLLRVGAREDRVAARPARICDDDADDEDDAEQRDGGGLGEDGHVLEAREGQHGRDWWVGLLVGGGKEWVRRKSVLQQHCQCRPPHLPPRTSYDNEDCPRHPRVRDDIDVGPVPKDKGHCPACTQAAAQAAAAAAALTVQRGDMQARAATH